MTTERSKHRPARTTCGHCGGKMPKAQAIADGIAYCQKCYARVFRKVPCSSCGKPTKSPFGRTPVTCEHCRIEERRCVRCGKGVPRAGLVVPDGVVCPSCAPHFREPKPCPVCGHLSQRLCRDFKNGFLEPVCERCRRQGFVTCAECGKHRRAVSVNAAGKAICAVCAERQGAPFICPTCGRPGQQHSKDRCVRCYWESSAGTRFSRSEAAISQEWLRKEFRGFFDDMLNYYDAKTVSLRLRTYGPFFLQIDKTIKDPKQLSYARLVELFGGRIIARRAALVAYFSKQGLIETPTQSVRETAHQGVRQQNLLNRAEGQPFAETFRDYHRYLLTVSRRFEQRGWRGKRARMGPGTISALMKSTFSFLSFLPPEVAGNIRQLEQADVDRFLREKPGHTDGLRNFVGYLTRRVKLFRPVKISWNPALGGCGKRLPQDRAEELLAHWVAAEGDATRDALLCTFMLLYAQRPSNIVQIKLEDISRRDDGAYVVAFGKCEFELEERVGRLMDRYLESRISNTVMERAWENPFLFPGRVARSHLSPISVGNTLKKIGVTARQLFATAMSNAYQNGLRHPKVLVNALGVTLQTAMKYLYDFDPRLADEVSQKLRAKQ